MKRMTQALTIALALFPAARHTLIERYGLDPDRVVVLPNAVDPDRVGRGPAIPGELRSTLGLDSVAVTKWVGYVGALSEEKRVHLAVEAVASRPDWGLLIAGDGPEEQWLRSLAAYLAPERIRFLGRRSEVAEVYDLMDALVLPSRTEGIPAVAIEAALHGVPVVATNVGGVAAAMANGVEGVLVDDASVEVLTDALASVLDGSQATAPSTNSRVMLLKHYDIAAAALAWDQLIAQAAALPAASQPCMVISTVWPAKSTLRCARSGLQGRLASRPSSGKGSIRHSSAGLHAVRSARNRPVAMERTVRMARLWACGAEPQRLYGDRGKPGNQWGQAQL